MAEIQTVLPKQYTEWPRPTLDKAALSGAKMSLVSGQTKRRGAELSAKKRLPAKFAEVRDIFSAESSNQRKTAVAYDLEMDSLLYRTLAEQRGKPEYAEAKEALDAYVKTQLETHLGERLHVGISRFVYHIVDGQLVTEDTGEPMLDMITRGWDYRRNHGKLTDRPREYAEIEGFARLQEVLTDEKTPVGTMMMFVSLSGNREKGSNYPMNIYEVHQKMADDTVVAHRFTSGLTPEESQAKLATFDPWYRQKEPLSDAKMLSRPVRIEYGAFGLRTPEDVHAFMHRKHEHMSKDDFAFVWQACQPIVRRILSDFTEEPNNKQRNSMNHRALLNYADEITDKLSAMPDHKREILTKGKANHTIREWFPSRININELSKRKVRLVLGGCGSSGDSAASVSEFDPKKSYTGENAKNDPNLCRCGGTEPHFHCEGKGSDCGHEIIVGKGISECPKCGAGQVC